MPPLICSSCGASNSEFDSRCANCNAPLPEPSEATVVDGGRYRKDPPRSIAVGGGEDDDELRPGQEISHFRILGRLGRGGMGTVYRALDLSLDRVVALKFLLERRRRDLSRLEREAKALAKLDHPNIGTIYDFHERDGVRFIVMALYDGETLAERLARQPDRRLSIPEAVAVTSQLANALQAAHAANLVHRDLKPENVMILPDGRVKLIDFGLARWPESARLTLVGHIVGTLDYMAPEQFDEDKEAGPEADLWALGVVLYEMLAGRHPFGGKGMGRVQAIMNDKPFPLRKAFPEVPAALEKIVESCLVKDPRERCSSAGDILAELESSGLLGSGAIVPPARLEPWQRLVIVAGALLLIGLSVAIYLLLRKPALPVYVAVFRPEVTGSLAPDDQDQVTDNLQDTLVNTVATLDGLFALDPIKVNKFKGKDLATVARIIGADEVISSQAACADDLCRVTLERRGQDGRVLWSRHQNIPVSLPLTSAQAIATLVRQGYPDNLPRAGQSALNIPEETYREYLDLRRRIRQEGANDDILAQLEALTKRAPSFIEAYFLAVRVARRRYEDTNDLRYLDRGLALAQEAHHRARKDPRPIQALFELNLAAGRLDNAEKAFKELNEIDPAGSLLQQGQLAERRGDINQALKFMQDAIKLQPSWQNLQIIANVEYKHSRYNEAKAHLEELLKRSPGNVEGLKTLAQIELLQNLDRAVRLLREITKSDPDPGSLTNLGVALLLLRRYGEAESSLRQALLLTPDDPDATLNLADCLTLLGRTAEARQLYARIVNTATRRATPGDWNLLAVKAQAHAHLGQKEEARQAIQEALRLSPDNGQLEYETAVVYVLLDDRGSALLYANKAAKHNVNSNWFSLPFFDSLRNEPSFKDLMPTAR